MAACAIVMVGMICSCPIASAGNVGVDQTSHILSLQVSVDGNEVMAPVLEMRSSTPAEVFIGSGDHDGYTLVVNIVDEDDNAAGTVGAHFVLWRGGINRGARLLDDVLLLGDDRRRHVGKRTLQSSAAGPHAAVTVVSHSTYTTPQRDLQARSTYASQGDLQAFRWAPIAPRWSTPGQW
jgi:hypothetical protein